MYEFEVHINDVEKRIRQSHAMHIMAGILVFTYGLQGFADLPKTAMQLYTALPASLVIFYLSFFKKKNLRKAATNRTLRFIEGAFLLMGCIHFFKYGSYLPAILFLLSALGILYLVNIERQVLGGIKIWVNEEGVTKPGLNSTQKHKWTELSNVMVQDDILTIDLKTNYLFQARFSNFMTEQQKHDFNNYCKQKLTPNV